MLSSFFSDLHMAGKKSKKEIKSKKPKKTNSKVKGTKKQTTDKTSKKASEEGDTSGIIVIDDELQVDKDAEHEERKAYLEEARSQESSD
jgi:uncharacterized protein YdaU (DUF1376 family)